MVYLESLPAGRSNTPWLCEIRVVPRGALGGPQNDQQAELRQLGEVFGDRVIATVILDRILHHAITLSIRGNSYRLKDKLTAGLVRAAEASE